MYGTRPTDILNESASSAQFSSAQLSSVILFNYIVGQQKKTTYETKFMRGAKKQSFLGRVTDFHYGSKTA